jgi:hypothetical protein
MANSFSAEAWHERYAWNDDAQYEAVTALHELVARTDAPAHVLCRADMDTVRASGDGRALHAAR